MSRIKQDVKPNYWILTLSWVYISLPDEAPEYSHLSGIDLEAGSHERTISLWRGKINPARLKIYIFIYIYVYMRITRIGYGPLSFHHKGTNLDTMVQSTQHIACIHLETTLFQLYSQRTPFPPIEHNLIPGYSHLSRIDLEAGSHERTISLWREKINPDGLNIYIYI